MQASQNDQIIVHLGNVGINDSSTEGKSTVQLRSLSYISGNPSWGFHGCM